MAISSSRPTSGVRWLPGAASSAACPHYPEQGDRLGHAFEFVTAALLNDKHAGNLTLHPRRHHDRTRLGQRLRPRGDIRHITEYFACRVEHHRPQVDGDPSRKCRLVAADVLAVQLIERTLDRERRPHRPLGVILLRHGIAEQRHQPVG
jgi:hypothetical protein